jgi:NAD(P)-dependent dehydrogenase (short-subunit alcohol dehydrogenase family)
MLKSGKKSFTRAWSVYGDYIYDYDDTGFSGQLYAPFSSNRGVISLSQQNLLLKSKIAIVTGGGRGIGKAIARKLVEAGAHVVIGDIDVTLAYQTASELTCTSSTCEGIYVDVCDEQSVASLVNFTLHKWDRVDILVNNAGILFRTRFPDITLDEWTRTMDVNLTGPFLCTQAVLPQMKKQKTGRIVNMSSSAGRSVSTLGGAHYTASKAGLLGLTRATAKELATWGITVNAICPGLIDTAMARTTTTETELAAYINSFPIRRLGLPEEIGDLVVFLCSNRAAYITGASFDINGGDLMM